MNLHANPWFALAIVSCALLMVGIDMTVLNVALPTLAHDLGATTAEKLWMVNAYSLVMAGLLPGFGALADKIGHRTMLMAGLAVFGLASAAAALSSSPTALIIARAFLGAGAAMMLPATLSTVRIVFSDESQRALAIGVWGAVWAGSSAIGPVFGGFLLEHFHWGAVFFINVPLVVVTLVLMALFVPHLPGDATRRWDLATSLLLTLALIAAIYGVKALLKPTIHWGEAALALGAGGALAWAFQRRQASQLDPLIDLSLFRIGGISLGAGVAMIAAFVLMGLQYALAQELQLVRGFSPLHAGLFVLPIAAGAFVAGPLLGALIPSLGVNRLMLASIAVGAASLAAYVLLERTLSPAFEAFLLAIVGFGIGGAMSVASTAIMLGAPAERAGQAGSIESLAYELGGTIGVAVMGSILASVYARSFLPPEGTPLPLVAWDSLDATIISASALPASGAAAVLAAGKIAFMHGMSAVLVLASAVMVALAIYVAIASRKTKQHAV